MAVTGKSKIPSFEGILLLSLLNDSSFLESFECAYLVDRAEAASRYWEYESFVEFRDKNALLLKVWVFADHAGWVELCSTSAI